MSRGLIAALFVIVAGCNGGDECLADLPADCAPLYEPTFQNVFDETLTQSCATAGASCHAAEGAQAGLVLGDIDTAHAGLLDGRVEPGSAACSLMMRRIESDDPGFQMPPGRKLSDAERCAIQKWIDGGAKR